MIYDMKKAILTLAILLAICTVCVAQRQKVTVGKDGEMIVNGDTVAYIEKEGCKLLSATCRFIVTDLNDDILITVMQQSFTDRERTSPEFPDGTPTAYIVFSFRGYDEVAETDSPFAPKEESVAKLIARWHLLKDKKLDPEAVQQFITANGRKFSDKERRQNQPPTIIIQQ